MNESDLNKESVEWYRERKWYRNSVQSTVEIVTEEVAKGLATAYARTKELGMTMNCVVTISMESDVFSPMAYTSNGTKLKIDGIAIKVGQ